MLYAIICEDVKDSKPLRAKSRAAHMARLHELRDLGRLILAGAFPAVDANEPGAAGVTGSLIVAEFDSLSEAQDWADSDPFYTSGVYQKISVKPYKKASP
ncbi:YciI family protein [Gilvimarinus agarilyticus]|uniref:YciI family protein n=1 Tax=Gilvimarinus sp. 2_MG-2023 TaxID=3062666 RepID=UPI001C09CE0C|nr:YciI family protein [Gilvimarinus sp. 2_MG-2023]MBU2885103.1 YciI family protein [Gilvimarinus agarilyticus]MDO6570000.1 YciI family protein [Gilvimarinus sp. 2_MG-2023]